MRNGQPWTGNFTEQLGDQVTKRGGTQDFLWLQNNPPWVPEPSAVPCCGAQPLPPTQPPTNPHCLGGEGSSGRSGEPSAAPTSLGATGCRASAAPARASSAFAPLALPSTTGHRGLRPGHDTGRGQTQRLPSLRAGREAPSDPRCPPRVSLLLPCGSIFSGGGRMGLSKTKSHR